MIVLLDSTELIDTLRDRDGKRGLLAELVTDGHRLATSVIDIGEVYSGIRSGEEAATEAFFSNIECYPVTAEIAQRAGELRNLWLRKGRTLTLDDMIVAATALEYGAKLMTQNRKDFPVEGLEFYSAS